MFTNRTFANSLKALFHFFSDYGVSPKQLLGREAAGHCVRTFTCHHIGTGSTPHVGAAPLRALTVISFSSLIGAGRYFHLCSWRGHVGSDVALHLGNKRANTVPLNACSGHCEPERQQLPPPPTWPPF